MKNRINYILLVLVVFLIATNVSTILTYQKHLSEEHSVEQVKIEMPDSRIGRFFKDELQLDEDQMNSFRECRRTYNRSANSLLTNMHVVREKMVEELKQVVPERKKLDDLAQILGDYHRDLKGLTFDYYFSMQEVLNEEQQDKMVTIFQAMLTEQGYAKTPGHNHQGEDPIHGEGRGRNHQNGDDHFSSESNDDEFIEFEGK